MLPKNMITECPYNPQPKVGKVIVYDSTLRDGEQMPGVAFRHEDKLKIASMLSEAGVPEIEAGFAAVSQHELDTIKSITGLGLDAKILSLSRARQSDIDCALKAGVDIVLLFAGTSDIHLRYKYGHIVNHEEILAQSVDAVEYAKSHGVKVSFSCEDGTRTPFDFLLRMYKAVEDAGADRLGITDTLGCITPEGISKLVRDVKAKVKRPVSVHLHNDFGLANANALSAAMAGADAITTTVNGMGERCGNVPLEQFASSMFFLYGVDLGIDLSHLTEISRQVSQMARYQCSVNHPITGENAFSHESGIHVAAIMNHPSTYEYIDPEKVGNRRHLRLGKHSGASYLKKRLADLGYECTPSQLNLILDDVKSLGEQQGRVDDQEFLSIVKRNLNS